jgi:hypothetical protein
MTHNRKRRARGSERGALVFVQRDGEQTPDGPNPLDLQETARIDLMTRAPGFAAFLDGQSAAAWRAAWRSLDAWAAAEWRT